MIKYFFLVFVCICFTNSLAQDLTGPELLEKSIAHHDPNDQWSAFAGTLFITMSTPDEKKRDSEVSIDLPKNYFRVSSSKEDITIEQILDKGECTLKLNGSSTITEADKKTHRISCERANTMKNYYTYLYGLPMKLKDPGTLIGQEVQIKTFKGKKYLVLKVNYDEEVGNDVWYFYFDPKTFAMEVYQFFHDEAKNDGEYILLSGIEAVNGIKMPKTRAWYYNSNNKYLGTDVLTKSAH